jgi:hypothetical protein
MEIDFIKANFPELENIPRLDLMMQSYALEKGREDIGYLNYCLQNTYGCCPELTFKLGKSGGRSCCLQSFKLYTASMDTLC